MKIVLLTLHILLAMMFGAFSIENTDKIFAALNMAISTCWSVCVGMDIAQIAFEIEDKK